MIANHKIHEGHNVKRIREILGVKQDTLAFDLNISQQAISQLEQKESIDPALLLEISKSLKVPVEAIQNFNEEAALNIISNTFNDHSTLNGVLYNPTFNPLDKLVEVIDENKKLYERLLQVEREKNELLQKMLEGMK
ncbi:MAG: helix-turn-helix transcriptional regulator [Ferruginibacter sp.]